MASLANQTISSTYDGLVKTSTDQPVPISGVQLLEDGVGNSLALSVGRANQGVTITGTATATAFAGPLTGNVTGDLTGTVLTAAQTNITSVGTLSSLAVSGNLTVDTNTLFVDAASNSVGIGTSSPSSYGGGYSALTLNGSSDGGVIDFKIGDTRKSSIYNTSVGELFVFEAISATAAIAFQTNSSERMRIDSSGNLLLGLTSSTYTTTNRTAIVANGTNNALLGLVVGGANKGYFYADGTNINLMSEDASGYMSFGTNNAERMRIDSAGNVLVGCTSVAGAGSSVEGSALNNYISIYRSAATVGFFSRSNAGEMFAFYNDTSQVGSISIGASSTAYNTSGSDLRLKKNIEDWTESVLDDFAAIEPVQFHFNQQEDTEDKIKGYIAQDMVDKFPEAYPQNEDGFYNYNPSGMVVYLMKAVKELKAEIETLKSQING